MSFDLIVWQPTRPADDGEALAIFERAMQGEVDDLLTSDDLERVYRALTGRFPDVNAETDEKPLETSLEYDLERCLLAVSMGWGEIADVAPVVVAEALRTGLSVFDPQATRHITIATGDPGDWAAVQEAGPTLDPEAMDEFIGELDEIERLMEADARDEN
jgi:hypothetical protein